MYARQIGITPGGSGHKRRRSWSSSSRTTRPPGLTARTIALVTGTKSFTDAARAGKLAEAQALYASTRMHYERIEPIAELFSDFLGTTEIDLTLTSTVSSSIFGTTRHFATADELRNEILYARLWAGLHYRNSSEEGIKLGRKVAHFDLTHAFAPAN